MARRAGPWKKWRKKQGASPRVPGLSAISPRRLSPEPARRRRAASALQSAAAATEINQAVGSLARAIDLDIDSARPTAAPPLLRRSTTTPPPRREPPTRATNRSNYASTQRLCGSDVQSAQRRLTDDNRGPARHGARAVDLLRTTPSPAHAPGSA